MKFAKMFQLCTLVAVFLFSAVLVQGQEMKSEWKAKLESSKLFIENYGQFSNKVVDGDVLYAYDDGNTVIYFTKKGVTYAFLKTWPKEKPTENGGFASLDDWKGQEGRKSKLDYQADWASFEWENANPSAEVIVSDEATEFFSYSFKDNTGKLTDKNNIRGYRKLTYKNIYPNIDVEYTFHPVSGIKYNLIIHPGGDVSAIKMLYDRSPQISANGDLHITTAFGDIIDHAPISFYEDNQGTAVPSSFVVNGNTVSFKTADYDHGKTLMIDPWVQTPSLPVSNGVWECDRDGAGNVYIIGGCMPMKLLKYNATGTLQWTHVTPWDTTNAWLGTFATDLAGNSYVTSGSIAALRKVDANNNTIYNYTPPILTGDEYWTISFNCDQTKLIIGGTSGTSFPLDLWGAIFDVNTSDGSVNSIAHVGSMAGGLIPKIQEVRGLTACRNARYYYLMLDTIGAIDQNFGSCPGAGPSIFETNSGYALAYKCEDYRPNNGNAGIMSIRANPTYLYTANGTTVHRRSLADGSILGSAAIPGGINTTTLGEHQIGNSGLDIDVCGNVYAGSGNGVYKYNAMLNPITNYSTSYKVYDVTVTNGGNLIVVGATGDNSWTTPRTGYVEYINMATCDPLTLECCDANICPVPVLCHDGAPTLLTGSTAGGTWSGTGITNPSNGTFDPTVAGVGTHWVYYTLSCGTDSIQVTVNFCATLYPCQESGGDITVAGGIGPYTWYTQTIQQNCSQCLIPALCQPPAANCPLYDTLWTVWTTGTTVTPVSYPILVMDANSNSSLITDLASLPVCGACPTITITPSNISNPSCYGYSDGSFDVTVTGGTAPYDYVLYLGGLAIQAVNNSGANENFAILGAGTYTLNILDDVGCPATVTLTLTEPAEIVVTLDPLPTVCFNDPAFAITGESPAGGTFWGTGVTAGTFYPQAAGIGTHEIYYAYTNGACGDTAMQTILVTSQADATITSFGPFCVFDSQVSMSATDPGGTWSGPGLINANAGTFNPSVMGVGSHVITYTIGGQCGDTNSATVTVVSNYDASIDTLPDICSNSVAFNLTAANGGGTWAGAGITNPTLGTFNPGIAGVGTHPIIYTIAGACGGTDTADFNVINCDVNPVIYVPNIFSPNGDGVNDVLYVHGQGIESLQFIVYDRWGEKVFTTNDNTEGWDGTFRGKPLESAVFMYYLKATFTNEEEVKWKGSITLVR